MFSVFKEEVQFDSALDYFDQIGIDPDHNDIEILSSWTEADENGNTTYLVHHLLLRADDGYMYEQVKIARLLKIEQIPRELREMKAFMKKQEELLHSVWSNNTQFINLVANILKPPLGFIYCYGVQVMEPVMTSAEMGTQEHQEALQDALEKGRAGADYSYAGLVALLQGNYKQIVFRPLTVPEMEAVYRQMVSTTNLQILRGIPYCHVSSGIGTTEDLLGQSTTPDAAEQNEELYRGMSEDEYAVMIVATPIAHEYLNNEAEKIATEVTRHKSLVSGAVVHQLGGGIPLAVNGTVNAGVGYNDGTSETDGYTLGAAHGISQNSTVTAGSTDTASTQSGTSHTASLGSADNIGQSLTETHGRGTTQTETTGTSIGQSETVGTSRTHTNTSSVTNTTTSGVATGVGNTLTSSIGMGVTDTRGSSFTEGNSYGTTDTISRNQGVAYGTTVGSTQTSSQGSNWTNSLANGASDTWNRTDTLSNNYNIANGTGQTLSRAQSQTETDGTNWNHTNGTTSNTGYQNSYGDTRTNGTTDTRTGNVNVQIGHPLSPVSFSGGGGGSQAVNNSDAHTSSVAFTGGNGTTSSDSSGGSHTSSRGTTDTVANTTNRTVSFGAGESHANGIGGANTRTESSGTGGSTTYSNANSQSSSTTQSYGTGESHANSKTSSASTSQSQQHANSQTTSNSRANSNTYTVNTSSSRAYGQSVADAYGTTHSVGQTLTKSLSHANALSETASLAKGLSLGQTASRSIADGITAGQGYSHANSLAHAQGSGSTDTISEGVNSTKGITQGTSSTYGSGMGSSMSFVPTFGYARTYQTWNQNQENYAKLALEQNSRYTRATIHGAFHVEYFLLASKRETASKLAHMVCSAFHGPSEFTTVQVLEPDPVTSAHLLKHAITMTGCSQEESYEDIPDRFRFSSILLPEELTSYTHIPRSEVGGIMTTAINIPAFTLNPRKTGQIYLGKQVSCETGNPSVFDYRIEEHEMMHIGIFGVSGSGKTRTSERVAAEVIRNLPDWKVTAVDWKDDWRELKRHDPDNFAFNSLAPGGVNPIRTNVYVPPKYISVLQWVDKVHVAMSLAYGFGPKQYAKMNEIIMKIFEREGITEKGRNGAPREAPDAREKVCKVTIVDLYEELAKLSVSREESNNMKETYIAIMGRLHGFVEGEYRALYCETDPNEIMRIDEIIDGKRIVVLEGGHMDDLHKKFIIPLITRGIFMYSVERKGREDVVQKRLFIIEEAHEVIVDTKENPTPLQINEDVFGKVFNEARAYGLYCMPIAQSPSELPQNVVNNCAVIVVHALDGAKNLEMMTQALTRNYRLDNRDVAMYLTKIPVGEAIVRIRNRKQHWLSEPTLVKVDGLMTQPPKNEELVVDLDAPIPTHYYDHERHPFYKDEDFAAYLDLDRSTTPSLEDIRWTPSESP